MRILKGKQEARLPDTLFDRIGVAAVGISTVLEDKMSFSGNAEARIWENIGYVLATLKEAKIIRSVDALRVLRGLLNMYDDKGMASECFSWVNNAFKFYGYQVYLMAEGRHTMPDVIIYNLTHPTKDDRKDFDSMPLYNVDIFFISYAWKQITEIMGHLFFRNDENLANLPLGI